MTISVKKCNKKPDACPLVAGLRVGGLADELWPVTAAPCNSLTANGTGEGIGGQSRAQGSVGRPFRARLHSL